MRSDQERLLDIREAIQRIEKYASRGRKAFETDELLQSWIVRHLQVIGEASRALSVEFRSSYPEVPWTKILGMRNVLVHDYFAIDKDVVWTVVERDLQDLKTKVEEILRKLGGLT
ncbi:MAG: HepT-like ribonuclease domain-containing protein [Nitrospiraceae bacterium]